MPRINFYHRHCTACGYNDDEALYTDERDEPCPACGGELHLTPDVSHLGAFKLFTPYTVDGIRVTSKEQQTAMDMEFIKKHGHKPVITPYSEQQRQVDLDTQRHEHVKKLKAAGNDEGIKKFTEKAAILDKNRKAQATT